MFTPGFPIDSIPARSEQGKGFDSPATTTAAYSVGTRRYDDRGREYQYFFTKTNTSIAAGDCCALVMEATHDGATPISDAVCAVGAAGYSPLGICMIAVTAIAATKQYCWFCIFAPGGTGAYGSVLTVASATKFFPLNTCGTTVGQVTHTTTAANFKISGLTLAIAQTAGASVNDTVIINYPRVGVINT